MSTSICTRCGVRFLREGEESICPFCTADQAPESTLLDDLARGFLYGTAAALLAGLVWYWIAATLESVQLSVLFAGLMGLFIPTAFAHGSLRKPGLITQEITLVLLSLAMVYSQYYAVRSLAGGPAARLPAFPNPISAGEIAYSLVEPSWVLTMYWLTALGIWIAFPLLVRHDTSGYLGVLARRLR